MTKPEQKTAPKVVELLPGRYFLTYHKDACVIWKTPEPWCNCGGYENNAIKEIAPNVRC